MIKVDIEVDERGCIKSLSASGHAGFARKGKDIVCAAASILIDTTAKMVDKTDGAKVICSKEQARGNVFFTVETTGGNSETEGRLRYAADFLIAGLKKVESEYPRHLELTVSGFDAKKIAEA